MYNDNVSLTQILPLCLVLLFLPSVVREFCETNPPLLFFPSLSLEGNKRAAMNMGARSSVTSPRIVKTPNRPAQRSGNIVTMRNLPPKVSKVPPAQCMCRTVTTIAWGTLCCQHSYRLLIGVHRYCTWGAFSWLSQQALESNISKAHQISGITKNQTRRTLTCSILWKKMQLSLFSGTSQTQLKRFPLLTLVHEEQSVRSSFKKTTKAYTTSIYLGYYTIIIVKQTNKEFVSKCCPPTTEHAHVCALPLVQIIREKSKMLSFLILKRKGMKFWSQMSPSV